MSAEHRYSVGDSVRIEWENGTSWWGEIVSCIDDIPTAYTVSFAEEPDEHGGWYYDEEEFTEVAPATPIARTAPHDLEAAT